MTHVQSKSQPMIFSSSVPSLCLLKAETVLKCSTLFVHQLYFHISKLGPIGVGIAITPHRRRVRACLLHKHVPTKFIRGLDLQKYHLTEYPKCLFLYVPNQFEMKHSFPIVSMHLKLQLGFSFSIVPIILLPEPLRSQLSIQLLTEILSAHADCLQG